MSSYCIDDYVNLPAPDTIWVWDGILPASGSMLLYADPKVGKSKLALSLSEAIADESIDSYLGQSIKQHGKVLYIQLDTPRNLWKNNYIRYIKSAQARKNIYIIDKELPDIPIPFDLRTKECQKWVRDEVDRVEPAVVWIDTIRRMHRGDENDPTIMAVLFDIFQEVTAPAAMGLIAHKKKQQAGEVGDGTARGSTALTGAVDALVNMTKKALKIQARSDVAEEIGIWQQEDGTWAINDRESEIIDFISAAQAKTGKPGELDKLIAEEFKVTPRTARRWRVDFGETK